MFAALCLILVGAANAQPYTPVGNLTQTFAVPLGPPVGDGLTFQRTARSTLLNLVQVTLLVGPCAVRLPHWHAVDELIVVLNNTLGFVVVEPNLTVTDREVPDGTIIELPRVALHAVYNPTCESTYYSAVFTGVAINTYNAAYALPVMGGFVNNATYSNDGQPMLRYPGIAPTGQWVYNPQCLQECGITLPPNLVDVDNKPASPMMPPTTSPTTMPPVASPSVIPYVASPLPF